ncbi:DUF4249 family protein [Croceitalea rosinachiae]|uniref:DUF4249 family protein n=1 Tax=Croceitalea rosinachiae TaxID=3075596 RepID=A0ABU3AAM6_9FLAO|nr:DUF4249 family protein [Croceitalea sp. F388]MDT0607239.1 DUF4249 family protein [Croceitalea sp. F388]
MKRNCLFIFLAFLSFTSCEEAIDVDLPVSRTQLAIDALIGYNENAGDPITIGQIKLTLTAPFLEQQVPAAENATVQIIDDTTGEVFSLSEIEPGIFRDGFPNLEFNKLYTLRIIYNGEIYIATEQLIKTGNLVSVEQGDGFLFDQETETEVRVNFTDIPNERNYYLFSFGFENYLVTDDEFYQNSNLNFSYFYEDVEPGDLLTVTLLGIDKKFANYVDQVLVQSGDGGGGPFSTIPSTVRGNIINTTNPENFAFGYFSISEFDIATLTIE